MVTGVNSGKVSLMSFNRLPGNTYVGPAVIIILIFVNTIAAFFLFYIVEIHGNDDFWVTITSNNPPYATGPLSVLSVCNIGVLWPNGGMDQDAT